jgi:hypothetical protein
VPFRAGETFLFPLDRGIAHLWVIATEPDTEGLFVCASFTTLKAAKDQTVIFRSGEHGFVTHDTCVCYALAEITGSDVLQEYLDTGRARMRTPVTQLMLEEILSGFIASDFTKNRIREYVRSYRASRGMKGAG